MNDSDLERLLKRAEVPARPDEYWEQFPKRVTAKTHWLAKQSATPASGELRKSMPARLRWGLGLASACVIVGLAIGFWSGRTPYKTELQFAQAQKYFREIESLFPNQIQSIVFDEEGARLVLAEKADVPDSPAIYLKVCGPRGCQGYVTFSGQQIRVNGEQCDVLVDAKGHVLLVGKQLIWSSASAARAGKYQIAARTLETSS